VGSVIKWILEKYGVMIWTGFSWLRTVSKAMKPLDQLLQERFVQWSRSFERRGDSIVTAIQRTETSFVSFSV
jgi:hypothetical protein